MNLHNSAESFKQLAQWLWSGKFHILSFASGIFTLLYIVRVLNFCPTTISTILLIIGLGIILSQLILDAREFADHKPNTIQSWIKAFPIKKPIVISLETGFISSTSFKAHPILTISEDAPIERKIDFLLQRIKEIQEYVYQVDDRIDTVNTSLRNNLTELKAALDKIDISMKKTIAGHVVGTYDFNLFGIIITICGTLIQLFRS